MINYDQIGFCYIQDIILYGPRLSLIKIVNSLYSYYLIMIGIIDLNDLNLIYRLVYSIGLGVNMCLMAN